MGIIPLSTSNTTNTSTTNNTTSNTVSGRCKIKYAITLHFYQMMLMQLQQSRNRNSRSRNSSSSYKCELDGSMVSRLPFTFVAYNNKGSLLCYKKFTSVDIFRSCQQQQQQQQQGVADNDQFYYSIDVELDVVVDANGA